MKVWVLSLALVCSSAMATNNNPPSNNSPNVEVGVGIGVETGDVNVKTSSNSASNAVAGASADSSAQSVSESSVTSTNLNTVAGGEGGAASARAIAGDSTSSASGGESAASADNSLSLTQNYHHERSAPSVVQGSIYAGQCVSAGNAGGSNTGGSAFLGLSFTPYECHLARQAAAYEAAGDTYTACEIRRRSPSMQRLKKDTGFEPPPCQPAKPVAISTVAQPEPVDTSKFVTRDELLEHERRIVTAVSGK
jgi:hypothetical protein